MRMQSRHCRRGLWSASGVLALATGLMLPGVAFAQDGAPQAEAQRSEDGGIREIVVTATRREQSLQRAPVSVTALTGEALAQAGVTDTTVLQQQTPSLQIVPSGGGNPVSTMVSLRGQIQNAINITNDPSVALYVDDIYVGKDAGNVTDITDVQRIEVLKGPQGTLFGRNSTGGAIRYISNKPDPAAFAGSIRAGYGNFDDFKFEGMLNVPISDQAALRYAGTYRQHDGYTTTIFSAVAGGLPVMANGRPVEAFRRKTDDLKTQLHRLSLLIEPTDDLSLTVIGTYHKRRINGYLGRNLRGDWATLGLGFGFSPEAQADFYTGWVNGVDAVGHRIDPYALAKGWGISGTLEWTLSDTTSLKLISGYLSNKTVNQDFDVEGTVVPGVGSNTFQNFKQFSTELQLSGSVFDDKLDYVTGLYYFRERGRDVTDSSFTSVAVIGGVPNVFGIRSTSDGIGINKSYSGFAHLRFHVTDSTTIQGGVRYTEDVKSLAVTSRQGIYLTNGVPTGPFVPACAYTGGNNVDLVNCRYTPKTTFKFWSYLIGIDQQISDNVFGYVKTSRTQRSGGHQIRATNGNVTPFKPETITDYEVGLKMDLLDRHVRTNIAAFYGIYKDIQFTGQPRTRSEANGDPVNCGQSGAPPCTGPTTTVVVNSGSAHVYGGEFELNARYGGFGFDFGVSYTNVDFQDTIRHQFYTPRTQLNAAVSYEHETSIGKASARVSYFWKDKVNKTLFIASNLDPAMKPLPAVGIWNARLGLDLNNGFNVSFHVENIGKKKYYVDALSLGEGSPPGSASIIGYGFQPRTYGVEVGYKF